jgi:hypothetical protein
MYVGTLSNLCEFEKPNAQMYEAVGTDHRLAELDFVELKDAPELKAVAEKAIRDAEVKSGVKSSIGAPRSCYTMSLTSKGANVRTVITHMFATAFSGTPTLVAQAEVPTIPQAKTPAPGVIAKASKPAKVATLGK